MTKRIDYFLALQSPWTYLGHDRLQSAAGRHGAEIMVYPVDFARIFAETGGLPLPQRPPARRAYRMAGMVIAAREAGHDAMALAGAVLRAVWAEEQDTSDPAVLAKLAGGLGLDGEALIAESQSAETNTQLSEDTDQAITAGVFGAPSYVFRGELYWGQDRLEFLDRALDRD
jgi:2-hydroxychromene-2-carboxylate isomerase